MKDFFYDIAALISRAVQKDIFCSQLEGVEIQTEIAGFEQVFYWKIENQKLQPTPYCTFPSVKIRGHLDQWLELFLFPQSYHQGCQIEGDLAVLQQLQLSLATWQKKENISFLPKFLFIRSIMYRLKMYFIGEDSFFCSYQNMEQLRSEVRNLYERLDKMILDQKKRRLS